METTAEVREAGGGLAFIPYPQQLRAVSGCVNKETNLALLHHRFWTEEHEVGVSCSM